MKPAMQMRVTRDDGLVALVCLVLSVASILAGAVIFARAEGPALSGEALTLACGLGAAQAVALVGRRVSPVGCLVLVVALHVVLVAVVTEGAALQGVAQLVAAYTVGELLVLHRAVLTVTGIAVLETGAVALLGAGEDR